MEDWTVVFFVAAGLWLALGLVLRLCYVALVGALILFDFAGEQGFLGLAAYFACWVFLLPVMLVSSILVGIFVIRSEKREKHVQYARQRLGYDD